MFIIKFIVGLILAALGLVLGLVGGAIGLAIDLVVLLVVIFGKLIAVPLFLLSIPFLILVGILFVGAAVLGILFR